MKRIILLGIICLLGATFFAQTAHCLPWPPEMDLTYIKFDYNRSSHTDDALTLKENYDDRVTMPEWDDGGETNEKIAYIKSQSARKIKAVFWIDRTGYDAIHIYATKIDGDGIGNVSESTAWFDGEQTSSEATMTCSSGVPGSVEKSDFTWRWYFIEIDDYEFPGGVVIGDSGPHNYYVVLDEPQAPMAEPWTSVLDYACVWADGKSTSADVASAVTDSIYSGGLGDTDGDIDYDPDSDYVTGVFTFDLTSFLSALGSSSSVTVNCDDTGNLFAIFATALGLSAQSRLRHTPVAITTNQINCIGSPGWTTYDNWTHHHFGWYNNEVYDPCLMVDYNNPKLPKGMSQANFETYLIDEGSFVGTDTQSTTVE